ncbi:MAG: cation:proton antiporter [Verrucomicrobia bacterium]|nr:cation:proton antiporter [Verrucomicrobiota bacterium]MDA1069638.1 cation:proton antiporter [Verrucomicrobiota bacterium]
MHEGSILTDIAWIMVGAMVAALVFQKLRLPSLLGFLVVGVFLGPNLGWWPALVRLENVTELSELGVIFLMFYIGLEFDLDRLKQIFAPAVIALTLQTLLMLFLGIQMAQWMGMSPVSGLFLGGVLSISSSMVSVKLIREMGLFARPHAQLTVGILVLEDILAILLLVLLSGIAEQGELDWDALKQSGLLIGVFIVAVYLLGKLGTHRVIKALESRGTTESVTLVTLGIIFSVSLLGDRFHFSWALGGFLAGAILSRSVLAKRIEHLTEPLRDFFTAMFFVSVGMLIDPWAISQNWLPIVLLSLCVIVGKFTSCWVGLFLSGQSPREAGRASLIKSQIGEFGFVIVAIGISYQVVSPDMQALVSGVAFVTIFLTPFLIRNEKPILDYLGAKTPKAAIDFCFLYGKWRQTIQIFLQDSDWMKFAGKPIARIILYFVIIMAIILGAVLVSETIPPPEFLHVSRLFFQRCLFVASLLFSLPFLVDTMRNMNVLVLLFSDAALSNKVFQQFSKGMYRSVFNGLILLILLLSYGSVFLAVAAPYFPTGSTLGAFLILSIFLGWMFWNRLVRMHNNWELAFMSSMQDEAQQRISKHISQGLDKLRKRQAWKVKVDPVVVSQDSKWVGKCVEELEMRSKTGAMIAGIERSGFDLTNIGPKEIIYPHDHLFLMGDPEQIMNAKLLIGETAPEGRTKPPFAFAFDRTIIPPFSKLSGIAIKDSNIRKNYQVSIIGIQRENERIVSPSADELLLEADMLLLMGSEDYLEILKLAILQNEVQVN